MKLQPYIIVNPTLITEEKKTIAKTDQFPAFQNPTKHITLSNKCHCWDTQYRNTMRKELKEKGRDNFEKNSYYY